MPLIAQSDSTLVVANGVVLGVCSDLEGRAVALWDKLVEIVFERWEGKPRRDLVRAVVALRDEMIECQTWYEEFRGVKEKDELSDATYPDPEVEWLQSLTALGRDILELDRVLSIFSPEAHRLIERYANAEMLERNARDTSGTAAANLYESPGFDIEAGELDQEFSGALQYLDEFIRSEFTPEEVARATQRW